MATAKPRTERQPKPPRARKTCKTCPATLDRNAKGARCRTCYDAFRALSADERRVLKAWHPFLVSWQRVADAIHEATLAEKLLLEYGRLARESGGKWRLTDLDLNKHRSPCVRFRRKTVLFLANVRKIAIVRSRGVCELLDPNQVSAA